MSERNPKCKRDAKELEASSESVSPLKKKKLDNSSSTDSRDVILPVPSSSSVALSTESAPGGCSVTSAVEDDDKSLSICSGCFNSESNQIAKKSPTCVVDLEAHQISETESLTFIISNFRKEENPVSEALGETTEIESPSATDRDDRRKPGEVGKSPTPAEIEEFFSELENEEKKRFIEKYNFDIVNDKPLEGRYKWDRLEP
ncbi:hypothetical protein EUTSA_v10021551mg [Eutrema salsugineum]|uniref:Cyclin-dependent kinase inhibitor n=1 Tax=Eutrema salsugineum TaxID=72664 RepID=V4LC59_EUTSA|nr:cyclin-dependent kinase inhibitor 6 [Eutrema salsugineum]ESQ47985.1 hypothetical protein EUTSA_v10021551mg [Eutrema salsugineum]